MKRYKINVCHIRCYLGCTKTTDDRTSIYSNYHRAENVRLRFKALHSDFLFLNTTHHYLIFAIRFVSRALPNTHQKLFQVEVEWDVERFIHTRKRVYIKRKNSERHLRNEVRRRKAFVLKNPAYCNF